MSLIAPPSKVAAPVQRRPTYSSVEARVEYPVPWVVSKQGIDICVKFGFTESHWKKIKMSLKRNDGKGKVKRNVRFWRDDLLRALEGER